MKALVLEAAGSMQLREIPEPIPGPGEVIISVESVGLGGSETLALSHPGIRPLPNIMGHGFVGVASEGRRVAVNPLISCQACKYCVNGARQLCDRWMLIGVQRDGGMAQRVAVPERSLLDLPERLSWEQATFIEPFANSISAWDKVTPSENTRILVVGAGGLGLGLIAMATSEKCSVEVLEPSANRAEAAQELGATLCGDANKRRFQLVFDTVGSADTRSLALRLTEKSGTIVLLGFGVPVQELSVNEMIRHEQTLIGSFIFSADQLARASELAFKAQDSFVTNLQWPQVQETLEQFGGGNHDIVKAALRPNL